MSTGSNNLPRPESRQEAGNGTMAIASELKSEHQGGDGPYSPPNPADPDEAAALSDPPDGEQMTVEIRTAQDRTLDLPAAPHEEHAGSRFVHGPPLSQSDERVDISLGPGAHRIPGPGDQPQEEPATREHERHEDAEPPETATTSVSHISNDSNDETDSQIAVAEPVNEPSSIAIRIHDNQGTSGPQRQNSFEEVHEAECSIAISAVTVIDAEDPIVERDRSDELIHDDTPSYDWKWKRLPFHVCVVFALISVAVGLGLSRPWSRLDTVVDVVGDGNLIQSKQWNASTADASTRDASTADAYGLNYTAMLAPPMPTAMSGILAVDHTMFLKGVEAPLAFSGDCTVVAASSVDEWKEIVQTVTYNASSEEWSLCDDGLTSGNLVAGDRFGDWLDFSEDGLILAVAMPRSSPDGIPE